nr:aminotransferase class I/II-fold pyridoxal phosphate-dependent enzyme [Bacteriovoracaceae bacterium]
MIASAHRLQNIEEYYFSKKLQEIQKLNAQGLDIINLGIGSPDLAPASEVKRAATQAINLDNTHGYASYRSIPELRKSMAIWLEQTYLVKLDFESEILPLLGSKEGIM